MKKTTRLSDQMKDVLGELPDNFFSTTKETRKERRARKNKMPRQEKKDVRRKKREAFEKEKKDDFDTFKGAFLNYLKQETFSVERVEGHELEWDALKAMVTANGYDTEVRDVLVGMLLNAYVNKHHEDEKKLELVEDLDQFMIKNGS